MDDQLLAEEQDAGELAPLQVTALAVLPADVQHDLEGLPPALDVLGQRVVQGELLPRVQPVACVLGEFDGQLAGRRAEVQGDGVLGTVPAAAAGAPVVGRGEDPGLWQPKPGSACLALGASSSKLIDLVPTSFGRASARATAMAWRSSRAAAADSFGSAAESSSTARRRAAPRRRRPRVDAQLGELGEGRLVHIAFPAAPLLRGINHHITPRNHGRHNGK
ncbi:hypothetical protein O1L44_29940 [Streptomyces noursei]|nr:hypothetical protein [Streptomyces noursei]